MRPRDEWKITNESKYQVHVTIPSNESKETNERAVHIFDLVKREEAYGKCGECYVPGTGYRWCQLCNAKRFKENFKNWTSGNKDIDEFIQQSQLKAVYHKKCLEWIPFENFQEVTYITRGGFGKVYSADWSEGYIKYWDIENQKWDRIINKKVALKSLDNSSNISIDFLNEIKSHLQIYLKDIVQCYGITQDPNTKDYMMVLNYCKGGNLRDNLNESIDYEEKIEYLSQIARGLLDIHNAGKVHKDFHSGNILFSTYPFISDLGMCQPANNEAKKKEIYGVLPYMAPEVIRRHQYTKASDIYSFGIVMNEFMSEETPCNNIPHDHILAVEICEGLRPKISEDTPKLLAGLITKCWDAKAENRPTAKELHQILNKLFDETRDSNSDISSQIKECRENKLKNNSEPKNIHPHPQAIYNSRLINFVNSPDLPIIQVILDPISTNPLSSTIPLTSANPIVVTDCLDCKIQE